MLEISQPFIISPSRVIGVIDPRNYKFSRVDQQAAVEASIRGKIIHRLIELGLSHHQDNPDPLTRFVRRYSHPISTEKPHSVDLGSNVTLWAKPDVVVGVGGFASGPTLKVAVNRRIPVVIQEQNSYPGITNRLLAKHAEKICVAYDGMEKWFPAGKILKTGNPVRENVINIQNKKDEAFRYFAE